MKEFLRKILIKITGIGWCDTPRIQMIKAKEEEDEKPSPDSHA